MGSSYPKCRAECSKMLREARQWIGWRGGHKPQKIVNCHEAFMPTKACTKEQGEEVLFYLKRYKFKNVLLHILNRLFNLMPTYAGSGQTAKMERDNRYITN